MAQFRRNRGMKTLGIAEAISKSGPASPVAGPSGCRRTKTNHIKAQIFMTTEANPIHHTQKIKAQMHQLIEHLREDIGKVTEPKAQALFETTAEVLIGLAKAFDDYEKKSEAAWRTEPTPSHPKERIL